MSDPHTITADAFEILVGRELRRIGVEPVQLRRRKAAQSSVSDGYAFDLHGRLEAYGHRWSALIECRNRRAPLHAADVAELRTRASSASASSAIMFTASSIDPDAIATSRRMMVPLLRVIDAHAALIASNVIQAGQMPAWLPEFTIELVTPEGSRLLDANDPESLLRELRPQA